MSFFKSANIPLLMATSIAARGLDVNYDFPNHYEDYVHRCGRTGRAGNKSYAYTFITPEQKRYGGRIIEALELSSATVPDELKSIWDEYVKEMEAIFEVEAVEDEKNDPIDREGKSASVINTNTAASDKKSAQSRKAQSRKAQSWNRDKKRSSYSRSTRSR